MRIAVVRPSMLGRPSPDALQPLIFGLLRTLTPPDVELTLLDGMARELPDPAQWGVDAVAMTVETFAAREGYRLADRCRALGLPVIMGGYHPTLVPDEAAAHADALVLGEAEDTWPQVLTDLRAGTLQPRYLSSGHAPIAAVDAEALPVKGYPPLGLVQFGRGCRFACEFCAIHAFHGATVRTRPVGDVLADVRARPQRNIFFVDDNLIADIDAARELFTGLIGAGKRWVCQVTMDVATTPGLLDLMREAGCALVLIGFESLDPRNLRQMGKGSNLRQEYGEIAAAVRAAGIMIYGTFIIGYDHDGPGTALELADFAEESGFAIGNFNPLMAMPGTRLYERLAGTGELVREGWWLDEDFRYGDAMLLPAGMTAEELTDSCRAARFRFYGWRSIVRRGLSEPNRAPANALLYWGGNLISARQVRAKQGRKLGADRR